MWNPRTLPKIARTQMRLLENGWKHLKKDGVLVYSTCSTEPEEDEAIISDFLALHPDATLEKIELKKFKHADAVLEFEGKKYSPEVKKTLRVWPQNNDTQGFYVAKLIKK